MGSQVAVIGHREMDRVPEPVVELLDLIEQARREATNPLTRIRYLPHWGATPDWREQVGLPPKDGVIYRGGREVGPAPSPRDLYEMGLMSESDYALLG